MDDVTKTDKMLARKDGRVGYVIFNNPERHNAVSLDMWAATSRFLDEFAKDDEVRVVVLTGAGGKAFVSGADISKFESERATLDATRHYNTTVEKAYAGVQEFPKPTIAMIRGYCIGGGLGLAVCCDLRICSDNSRFALPAAKLGLGYGYAGLKRFECAEARRVVPVLAREEAFLLHQLELPLRVRQIVDQTAHGGVLEVGVQVDEARHQCREPEVANRLVRVKRPEVLEVADLDDLVVSDEHGAVLDVRRSDRQHVAGGEQHR